MAIRIEDKKAKLYIGSEKIKAVIGGIKVYSAGNICTYHVDGVTYKEEVDEGVSCLSPTSFTVPEKSGYIFAGWSLENGGNALTDLIMGDEPVELYTVYHVAPYIWINNDRAASGQTLIVNGSGAHIDYTFPVDHFNLQTRLNSSENTSFQVGTNQVNIFGLTTMHITLDYYKGSDSSSNRYFRVNSSVGAKYNSNGQVNGTITINISDASWVSISAACGSWALNNSAYCRVHKVWFT